MKFGIVGTFGTVDQVVRMAVDAEEAGWDGFFTWDAVDLGLDGDVWDPWAVLAAAAVRTQRLTLGALVFALPRRRPWVVARQAVTVDHLSGGRLVIPAGIGVPTDRGFVGVSGELTGTRERAELLDDHLAILDLAFRGETFSYAGAHHTVTDLTIRPRPVQRPRVPIWVVGAFPSERSMGRAARYDGVVPQLRGDRAMENLGPAEVAEVAAWVREHRAPDAGPFEIVLQGVLPDDPAEAHDHAAALAEAGATWFVESRWEGPGSTYEALTDRIHRGVPTL
ncbi:LLM class flavin-dependent oxidoreductase [Cellulomonas fimi]|uniref:Luciferase-like, subgroup n=1 Tax=Cellulomonas fimi (strain ATCC 484 / DSM 20113 / JCM 1341 / CCUG 24087 / LMG 16345 / NBRC 15513 / NCIMB 8980 / NCTC 7547 / NRS-133) TaxID=590998 RepID=F4H4U8_CELFA|nr:LLM class flavin-dependent oxidoreductase [Cellulomonas fimi]AEE44299.1 Luciferase-like, subgroup [Cellulomonas fimi ATCC 484]NNH05746.1 LLM class flavin-dependent oxidoreductase [Cellulomonas fimi]VEH26072.1 Limonene 1,2-monooxygenase [Cellulomonas fimi]